MKSLPSLDVFNFTIIELSRLGKRVICERERGPSDSSPFMIWQGAGEDDVHIFPLKYNKNSSTMLKNTFSEALTEFGLPRYIAVIGEAYVKSTKDIEEVKNIQHGELQENFLNNYDASIKEVISVICFDLEGHILVNIVGYKYNDTGLPEFDEVETTVVDFDPERDLHSHQGLTMNAIKEFITSVKGS